MTDMYYWSPHERRYIDAIAFDGRGHFSAHSRERLELDHGPLLELTGDELDAEIIRDIEQRAVSSPIEICESRYQEMLEILPPLRLVAGICNTSSFRLIEPHAGSIHPTFVRVGDRYFEAMRPLRESHADLVELVERVMDKPSHVTQRLN